MKNLIKIAIVSLFIYGCAQSLTKVSLPADTNTKSAIAQGDAAIQKAYTNQWDVLAHEELMKSSSYLRKAKQYDRDGKDQAQVLEQLGYYQAYYNEAQSLSAARTTKMQGLLTARETVLNSGIRQANKEESKLSKLDSEFRELAIESTVNVKEYSELQNNYIALSAEMKKNTALATARDQVVVARKNKAQYNAPSSLNMAELDIKNAENLIDSNQQKPEVYQPAIDKANRSAGLLAAIVAEQKASDFNLDETSAKKLVTQKGLIAKMDAELALSKQQLSSSRSDLISSQIALENSKFEGSEKEKELSEKEKLLAQAEAEKRFQIALESARQKFTPTEADVYRQGDKLLIRLKTVAFASGTAALPEASKTILDKVTTVAQGLSPKEIVVEGHTDSVGSATINDELSKKRADTVASYLKEKGMPPSAIQSVGFGFQKPLSSNKSKEGRAQNRRVDIWITPEGVQSMPQDATKTE